MDTLESTSVRENKTGGLTSVDRTKNARGHQRAFGIFVGVLQHFITFMRTLTLNSIKQNAVKEQLALLTLRSECTVRTAFLTQAH